jgi:hypothetical protein
MVKLVIAKIQKLKIGTCLQVESPVISADVRVEKSCRPAKRIGVKLSLAAASLSIVSSPVRDVIAVENSY